MLRAMKTKQKQQQQLLQQQKKALKFSWKLNIKKQIIIFIENWKNFAT